MEKTAKKMNKTLKVDGFRSGSIPFDIVKKQVGEMNLLQYSMEDIIDKSLHEALEKENLKLFITPKIDVDKLAPNNPIVYKATVYLLPEITLKNWEKISVKADKIKVTEKEIETSLNVVLESMIEDKKVDRKSKAGDKMILDFDVFIDKVLIENGSAKSYELITGTNSMIPGFEEKVMGLKAEEEKTFSLDFPKNYPHKPIAGKTAEFKVKVINVLERISPEINNDLAKQLKFETVKELKTAITTNLEKEKEKEIEIKTANDIFEALLKKAKFDLIHEVYIEQELKKMLAELKQNIEQQGGKYDDYLVHIKKTEEDLSKDMKGDAEKRFQTSLIIKKITEENKITVEEKDIEVEIANYFARFGEPNKEEQEKLEKNKRFKNYIEQTLLNKKVVDFIKEKVVKK
jgi:trigger factor